MTQDDLKTELTREKPLPMSHFWSKFKDYSFYNKRVTVMGVLRFLLKMRSFESRQPIMIGRNVSIVNRGGTGRLIAERAVRISENCVIRVGEQGLLRLGARAIIGPNTRIMAATQVLVGARCMTSWNCSIFDSLGHRMRLEGQEEAEIEAPITIGDDVWIGPYATIMKGVTIGNNCIVGAGSVVRRDVPANTLVMGNPARPVAKVDTWER